MPFKKVDDEEARQIKYALATQNGEVSTSIENPYLAEKIEFEDQEELDKSPIYYCRFGRNWDLFNRYTRDFDEAKALADKTALEIKQTCTVYCRNVPGPIYSAYYTEPKEDEVKEETTA